MKLVSVYIPTRSRPDQALRAVMSVLQQTYSNLEILLVDDYSDPIDFARLSALVGNLRKVRLLMNERTPGACGARNTAILHANGLFITGLDDDDTFAPGRIAELVYEHSVRGMPICTNYVELNEESGSRRKLLLAKEGSISPVQLFSNNLVGNQIFARRADYINAGLFDEDQLCWQDYDMWVRMMLRTGQFWKKNSLSYEIYTSTVRPRITNNPSKSSGILRFIHKHAEHLSDKNSFVHWLSYYERNPTVSLGLKEIAKAFHVKSVQLLVKKFIKKNFPSITNFLIFRA